MDMGEVAWGDDVATLWLRFLIEDVDDPWLVDTTLARVTDGSGRWSLRACEEAIAAAELVAAAGRNPGPGLGSHVLAWLEPHWPALWHGNRRAALAAVDAVMTASALRARWQGTDGYESWTQRLEDLRKRLS